MLLSVLSTILCWGLSYFVCWLLFGPKVLIIFHAASGPRPIRDVIEGGLAWSAMGLIFGILLVGTAWAVMKLCGFLWSIVAEPKVRSG